MTKEINFSELKNKLSVKTTGEFKNIELTDEQYERLITLLKIGISVAAVDGKYANTGLIDIDQYISSYARQFNADHLIALSETFKFYLCTDTLSSKIHILHGSFKDQYLRRELSRKLAERDVLQKLNSISPEKIDEAIAEIESHYIQEFNENDLDNVTIKSTKEN